MSRHAAPVTRENLIRRLAKLLDNDSELSTVRRAELIAEQYEDDELRDIVEQAERGIAPPGQHAAFHRSEEWKRGLTR